VTFARQGSSRSGIEVQTHSVAMSQVPFTTTGSQTGEGEGASAGKQQPRHAAGGDRQCLAWWLTAETRAAHTGAHVEDVPTITTSGPHFGVSRA